uniref:MADS-box transcription factor n=1 Tax=Rhizophora mucronata TaxID=61149 RepID=A0A2P2M8Z8_RHIMU
MKLTAFLRQSLLLTLQLRLLLLARLQYCSTFNGATIYYINIYRREPTKKGEKRKDCSLHTALMTINQLRRGMRFALVSGGPMNSSVSTSETGLPSSLGRLSS